MPSPCDAPKEPITCPLSALAAAATISESAVDKPKDAAEKKPSPKRRRKTIDDPTAKRPRRRKTQTESASFPSILMGILLNPKYADIIAFLSDERRFIIVSPLELETSVLPLYAQELGGTGITYQQFIEMLCAWGFQINNDEKYPDINVYSHPKFIKGDWDSCLQIEMVVDSAVALSEAALLHRMEASRASRRLSGVGLNNGYDMRSYFLQNQMTRRLSLPTPLPQSMLVHHQMKMQAAASETSGTGDKEKNGDGQSDIKSASKEKSSENDNITVDSDKIVAEAKAALERQPKTFRRPSMEHNMNPSQLNVMTEQFLQRSMKRRLSTLPMFGPMMYGGVVNNDVMKEVGAQVDAQAKVLFAQRRRSSLTMQQQPQIMPNGGKDGSADEELSRKPVAEKDSNGKKDDHETSKVEVASGSKGEVQENETSKGVSGEADKGEPSNETNKQET